MEVNNIMRIVILANKYHNKIEPNVNVFTQQIAWSMCDQGAEVIVICPLAVNYKKKYSEFEAVREEITESNKVIKIYHPRYIGFGQNGNFLLKSRVKATTALYINAVDSVLSKIIQHDDILFAEFLCPAGVAASKLEKKYRVKAFMQCGEATYQGDRRYGNQYLEKALRSLTGVVALSGQNKKYFTDAGIVKAEKIIILPSGYRKDRIYQRDKTVSREKFGLPTDKFIVGFCGSFDDRKGILRLEKAIDGIDDEDIVLAACGKGKMSPTTEKLVWKGPINHKDLGFFYSALDVFAFPTYNEGCCTAIVEAIACGCPIISSDRSFNKEICDETNSILIEPDDIHAMKESILALKNNPEYRNKLSMGSLAKGKELSLDDKAYRLLQYFCSKE